MPATIKQVAQLAGVSTSTVSHVINGTHYVSPELTERVLGAVKELNYELNPVARLLAGAQSRIVGVIIPDLFNSYIGEIVRGIDSELSAQHYDVLLYTFRNDRNEDGVYAQALSGLVGGLLLIVPLGIDDYLQQLQRKGMPYVLIDQHGINDTGSIVESTNWQGAYDATDYLISLGHRRIGMIMGDTHLRCTFDRLDGYKAALADHGIPYDREFVVQGDYAASLAVEATTALLGLAERPTAILASNDVLALRVVDALRHHGMQVPDDISIVGFDDIPNAAVTHPALTTVRQSLVEMGRTAARMLLARIENPDLPREYIQINTQLIIRESTQPPKEREGRIAATR